MVPTLLQPHAMQAATPCDASLQPHVPQAFIFEAMLLSTPQTRSSFGVPTPFTHAMQRLHVLHPRLLLLPASVAAVSIETLTLTLFNPNPDPNPKPSPDPNPDPDPNPSQVCFETLAPLLLLAPPHLASVPFAIAGLSFHYGIALLQNIDFVSWWAPAYTPHNTPLSCYTPHHASHHTPPHAHTLT